MIAALDEHRIRSALGDAAQLKTGAVTVLDSVASTNTWLMQQAPPGPGRCTVALAEQQTAGRGQRGKRWLSPRGAGLYLSLAYTFEQRPEQVAALTLAVGVASLRALQQFGTHGLQLKWPNDIFAGDAKLGGILVDAVTGKEGRIGIVCGIGINVEHSSTDLQQQERAALDYPPTDLNAHCEALPDRSDLAVALIDHVLDAMCTFERHGLAPFIADWQKYDCLHGKPVDVHADGDAFDGTAQGIDDNGALLVATANGTRRVQSGSVRFRAKGAA